MTPHDLQKWLTDHAEDIFAFTDYEPAATSERDLAHVLEKSWFRDPAWNEPGYRFLPLGQDGSGGQFALWLDPRTTGTPCVVLFGSEGGHGVLAPGALAFVQALAYAPMATEYDKHNLEAPSRLSVVDNWHLSPESPETIDGATASLQRYRQDVEAHFGPLPPFETLTHVPLDLQAEFSSWVRATGERVTAREEREQTIAAETKRLSLRSKASAYASRSGINLSADGSTLKDGTRFEAICSSCGAATTCRLTRFEEFAFGLCSACYFSDAW